MDSLKCAQCECNDDWLIENSRWYDWLFSNSQEEIAESVATIGEEL